MTAADDPFLDFLALLSGDVVGFCPGSGGLDDAISSLSFLTLCDRHGIAVAPEGDRPAGATWFFGSAEDVAAAGEARRALLPFGATRLEALAGLSRGDVTVFCSDPGSLRAAELQGVPSGRLRLCRDPASGIDLSTFALPAAAGAGTVRFSTGAPVPGAGDGVALHLSGRGARWRSAESCRAAVQQAISLMGPYAEVVTTSPGLATLAEATGRSAVLRGTADAAAGEPSRPAGDAWRALNRAAQERDALALQVDTLRERLEAGFAAATIADERDARGVRLVPARRLEEFAERASRREQALEAMRSEADRVGRERDVEHAARVAALGAERAATERQLASLRDALDAAAGDRSALRGQVDAVLSSTSWKATAPLRAVVNAWRRIRGRGRLAAGA